MLEPLYEPYRIKNLDLPNRFAMAPITRMRSPGGGVPNDTAAEYYHRRAAGGIGRIITEGTLPEHPLAAHDPDIPRLAPEAVDGWRKVLDRVAETPAKTFVQIWHQGPKAKPGIAAFPLEEDGKRVVQEATAADRQELFDAFHRAATLAQETGFDGIELHGAYGYLLDSFMRSGNADFVYDLVRAIRGSIGEAYPIAIRFSQWGVGEYKAQQSLRPPTSSPRFCVRSRKPVSMSSTPAPDASGFRSSRGPISTWRDGRGRLRSRPRSRLATSGWSQRSFTETGRRVRAS